MPISIKEPIVVPEKTFDRLWASQITILSPKPNDGVNAIITMVPCSEDGMTLDQPITIFVNDVLEKVKADPKGHLAKAMYFLLAAIEAEYKEQVG